MGVCALASVAGDLPCPLCIPAAASCKQLTGLVPLCSPPAPADAPATAGVLLTCPASLDGCSSCSRRRRCRSTIAHTRCACDSSSGTTCLTAQPRHHACAVTMAQRLLQQVTRRMRRLQQTAHIHTYNPYGALATKRHTYTHTIDSAQHMCSDEGGCRVNAQGRKDLDQRGGKVGRQREAQSQIDASAKRQARQRRHAKACFESCRFLQRRGSLCKRHGGSRCRACAGYCRGFPPSTTDDNIPFPALASIPV